MVENDPCFKVFTEISFHNERLVVLGQEGLKVLEEKKKEGMPLSVHDPLYDMALKAAGIGVLKDVKVVKRCKWWNRGFCRERDNCSYNHQKGDCEEHLNGGCTQRGCTTLRHRKQCRYYNTSLGCHRGESCEYLHKLEKDTMESEAVDKNLGSQGVEAEVVTEKVEKEVQKEKETEKNCNCEVDCESSDVIMKENKIICVLKRAKCSESEWKEYEEKVESEMDLKDLLEDLGKVIEAASRLSKKNKEIQSCENNINEKVVQSNLVVNNSEFEVQNKSGSPDIENTNVENSLLELCEEAVKNGWIYCEICEYKCKNKNTIRKHMRTKHSQCISFEECGKLFSSEYSLAIHTGKDNEQIENESDHSFVFSESMLDEFL